MLLRHAADDFVLTAAEPNLAWFADLVRPRDQVVDRGRLRRLGRARRSRARGRCGRARRRSTAASSSSPTSGTRKAKIAGRKVRVSRTGYTGDLGYEVWCRGRGRARGVGRGLGGEPRPRRAAVRAAGAVHDPDRGRPAPARRRLRVVSRFAWTDADRATPHELGLGWMLRGVDGGRPRGSSAATRSGASWRAARPASGRPASSSTGATGTGSTTRPASIPPMDHTPVQEEMFLYDDDGRADRVRDELHVLAGAPAARRRSRGSRSRPRRPATRVNLEIPINHRYVHVAAQTARLPLYNPAAEDGLTSERRTKAKAPEHGRDARPLRRDRRRRRPQRPDQRRVPREGGPEDAGPRAARPSSAGPRSPRSCGPGFWFTTFSYALSPAAAGHRPGARPRQARVHAAADVVDVRADGERGLPAARPGPRREPAGDRAPQPSTTPTRTTASTTT